ncbi:hypothetical protein BC830DRAFT_1170976 [Chytriomyces sp. MP71]|nr:hypothetical protein BC830DRAFT_1170976 [Chytriomyces sp. MP71]
MDAKHASELALWSFLLIFYIASSVSAIAMPRTFFRGIARLEREPSLRRDINSGSSASAEGHSGLLSLLKGNDSANQIMYFGGPLIRNVEVSTIFYGNVSHADRINSFYKFVTSSPYMGLLAQYSTKEYEIGYGSFVESHFETHPRNVTKLDDVKDIQPYLRKLVKNGMLRPNENSYYSIHYPVGLTITDAYGSQSCVDFCGYHNTIDISDISDVDYLYYGVIPSHSSHCIGGCGYASDDFDNLSSVMSHELAEAITNPVIGVATVLGPPIGWYNPQFGGEVSDSCNTIQFTHMDANGANWTMQEVWDNVYSQCIGVVRGYRGIAAVQESEGPPTSYYPPSMTNYGGSLLENVQVKLVQAKTIRPDGNSFYPIYIAPGVTATRQGSVSCRDFCGYHAAVDMTYMGIKGITYVYYAVISDLTGACAGRMNH